jgi:hypothetical protein
MFCIHVVLRLFYHVMLYIRLFLIRHFTIKQWNSRLRRFMTDWNNLTCVAISCTLILKELHGDFFNEEMGIIFSRLVYHLMWALVINMFAKSLIIPSSRFPRMIIFIAQNDRKLKKKTLQVRLKLYKNWFST